MMKPVNSGARLRIRPTPDDRPDPVHERRPEVGLHREERAHPDVDQAHQRQAHREQPVELLRGLGEERGDGSTGRKVDRRAEVASIASRPR